MRWVGGACRVRVGPDGHPSGRSPVAVVAVRNDGGQATVELALIMPLLILLALSIVQVGVLVHMRVLVTHAAREAVREAAVGSGPDEVTIAAAAAGPLDPDRLSVDLETSGERVVVSVHYDAPTEVFLVGPLLGDVGFDASATMRLEQ